MNVHFLQTGVIQSDGSFFWHSIEIYTSEKKLIERINKSIEINKGYNVKFYNAPVSSDLFKYCNYECISTDDRPMDVFLRYRKVKVN